MTLDPAAIALGDQIHAEYTANGEATARQRFAEVELEPTEDEWMYVQIGIQSGAHAALQALASRGWIAPR